MLASLLIFVFTYFENSFYKSHNASGVKYFDLFAVFATIGFLFSVVGVVRFSVFGEGFAGSLDFFSDWRFWVWVSFELVGMFTLNLNYMANPTNHTAINVGVFFTVLLTPMVVYFLDPLFGFEDTLGVSLFDSLYNVGLYMIFYFFIGCLYFYPKIRGREVNSPHLIAVTTVALLMSFYVEVKILQTYSFNWFIYASFELMLSLVYLWYSFRREKGSRRSFAISHIKSGLLYTFYGSLNLVAFTLLATEVAVLARRVSQILSGMITDGKRHGALELAPIVIMILGGLFLLGWS